MEPEPWRIASAAVRGTDHVRGGLPCQDAFVARVVPHPAGERAVFVVSDGAGSAKHAEVGSRLACEAAAALLAVADLELSEASAPGLGDRLVAACHAALGAEAATLGATLRDLACTLVAAVVGPDGALFAQVGDGGVVVGEADRFAWIFWPDKGEHANETTFVTMTRARDHMEVAFRPGRVDELALFSDGLERIALDFTQRVAHRGFFEPMLGSIRGLDPAEMDAVARELAGFLDSPRVNDRTSDDKTLVLASRRGAGAS